MKHSVPDENRERLLGIMIGEQIKKARLQLALTQKELAERIGVSSRSVSAWETGELIPTVEHKKRIEKCMLGEMIEGMIENKPMKQRRSRYEEVRLMRRCKRCMRLADRACANIKCPLTEKEECDG